MTQPRRVLACKRGPPDSGAVDSNGALQPIVKVAALTSGGQRGQPGQGADEGCRFLKMGAVLAHVHKNDSGPGLHNKSPKLRLMENLRAPRIFEGPENTGRLSGPEQTHGVFKRKQAVGGRTVRASGRAGNGPSTTRGPQVHVPNTAAPNPGQKLPEDPGAMNVKE